MKKLFGVNYNITVGTHALIDEKMRQLIIEASFNELSEVFGTPSYESSYDGKTQLEWVFYSGTKTITVYDWKLHLSIKEAKADSDEVKTWNVGGRNVTFADAQALFIKRGLDINKLKIYNYELPARIRKIVLQKSRKAKVY